MHQCWHIVFLFCVVSTPKQTGSSAKFWILTVNIARKPTELGVDTWTVQNWVVFFLDIFIPTFGNDPIWQASFSDGLKPPTSKNAGFGLDDFRNQADSTHLVSQQFWVSMVLLAEKSGETRNRTYEHCKHSTAEVILLTCWCPKFNSSCKTTI